MTTTPVVPGVVYRHLVAGEGPWTIDVAEVDLRQPGLSIRAAHAASRLRGRETVRGIARRLSSDTATVVAAINADFFNLNTGDDENNEVIEGEIWKALHVTDAPQDRTHHVHTQFAMSRDGRPLMDTFTVDAVMLRSRHRPMPLAGVNYRPGANAAALYTPRFGLLTPPDSAARTVEIRLRPVGTSGDTTSFQVAGWPVAGGTTTLSEAPVLSLPIADTAGHVPHPGEVISIVVRLQPATTPLRTLVGGWPRLVVHGESIADSIDRLEGTFPAFSATRHPRTGVGFSRDSATLYLITVDGRQESSSGMSLAEFAALMLKLGVYEGLNLDGGGSSTMVINGQVVNHPSDPGGERAVGNALLVVQSRHE
ncbi:MAG: phosphodiester glycosidase family protein [Gemmatimonadales bacterium]